MKPVLRDLGSARFRANPSYELVLYDRLSERERASLVSLATAPDFYGVLRPRRGRLNMKSVSREAALLWFTLREPGTMPDYCRSLFGEQFAEIVAQMVFDETLQIEYEGSFVGGSAAHPAIYDQRPAASGPSDGGFITSLSLCALKYAQQMDLDDSARLAARLYFYNRVPLSPRLSRELPTEDAVAKHLGLDSGGLPRGASGASWTLLAPTPGNEGWRTFVLRDPGRGPQNLGFKLYVSPQCEHLADAVRATASVLGRRRAARFKVGRDLAGIVRPDKLVAYFSQLEELTETADELLVRLRGMPVHGVPFTSEIGGSGLLSWGMDPPRELQVLDWQTLTSWRVWLVGRLAVALLAARAYAGSLPPWQFAIDRVRLEGVDPQTWTPQQSLWRGGS